MRQLHIILSGFSTLEISRSDTDSSGVRRKLGQSY